jgi:hypothetical protein
MMLDYVMSAGFKTDETKNQWETFIEELRGLSGTCGERWRQASSRIRGAAVEMRSAIVLAGSLDRRRGAGLLLAERPGIDDVRPRPVVGESTGRPLDRHIPRPTDAVGNQAEGISRELNQQISFIEDEEAGNDESAQLRRA